MSVAALLRTWNLHNLLVSGVLAHGVARRLVNTAALVLGSGICGESATNDGDVRSFVIFDSWFDNEGCSCGRDEGRGMRDGGGAPDHR